MKKQKTDALKLALPSVDGETGPGPSAESDSVAPGHRRDEGSASGLPDLKLMDVPAELPVPEDTPPDPPEPSAGPDAFFRRDNEPTLVPPGPEPRPDLAPPVAAAAPPPPLALVAPEASLFPLEERLRRLEETLARLQAPFPAGPPPRERISGAAPDSPGAQLLQMGQRLLEAPRGAAPESGARALLRGLRRSWLLFDALADARAIVRMYVDPRYRLPWFGKLVPPALVALILTSWYWLPLTSIPLLGPLFDKVVDLVLGYVLFKVLVHEARRYRETAPDLPPALRL